MITPAELTRAAEGAYEAIALIDLAKLSVDMFTASDNVHQNHVLGACFLALSVARDKLGDATDALDQIESDGFDQPRKAKR